MKTILKLFFTAVFFAFASYIVYIETERYESVSLTLLKDLSKSQEMDLGSLLLGQTSSTMQDSKILELYMRSNEMYDFLNNEYNLSSYYISEELDPLHRLYNETDIPFYLASKENLVKRYNEDLFVIYDEPSGTLSLSFIHVDKYSAKKILESIIKRSDEVINNFAKENAEVALHFIEKQRVENKAFFIDSIKQLIKYQNIHHTIDPNLDVTRKNMLLGDLEGELVKNKVEYSSQLKLHTAKLPKMLLLKDIGLNLEESIRRLKTQMAGTSDDINELNTNVFDFELLKSEMEFNKEIYRQTLINQEQLKIEVSQNAKHMIVVSKPTLPDGYTYPNKPWDIFTLAVILLFLYSILMAIITIVRDHKD